MKVLTLHRPWSWGVSEGYKPLENRTWRPEKGGLKVGEPVIIHAGQKYDEEARKFIQRLLPPGVMVPGPDACPTGLVSMHRLAGVHSDPLELPADAVKWFFGPIAWLLRDRLKLKPFSCPGAQGLWDLTGSVLEHLEPDGDQEEEELVAKYLPPTAAFRRLQHVSGIRLPGDGDAARLWNKLVDQKAGR